MTISEAWDIIEEVGELTLNELIELPQEDLRNYRTSLVEIILTFSEGNYLVVKPAREFRFMIELHLKELP